MVRWTAPVATSSTTRPPLMSLGLPENELMGVSAFCEYQLSPARLEAALRSDQPQGHPPCVAAGLATDRLAHHLHIEEIGRSQARPQLCRYRAGNISCCRQPGPDRAHGEKS